MLGEHRQVLLSAPFTAAKRKPRSAGKSDDFNANECHEICFDRGVGFGVLLELACGLSNMGGEGRPLYGTP